MCIYGQAHTCAILYRLVYFPRFFQAKEELTIDLAKQRRSEHVFLAEAQAPLKMFSAIVICDY